MDLAFVWVPVEDLQGPSPMVLLADDRMIDGWPISTEKYVGQIAVLCVVFYSRCC